MKILSKPGLSCFSLLYLGCFLAGCRASTVQIGYEINSSSSFSYSVPDFTDSYTADNNGKNSGTLFYFVDKKHAAASDHNAGTGENLPLKTFRAGLDKVGAGATLLVKDGTYTPSRNEYKNISFTKSGNPDNYIVIAAYPGHRPVIYVDTWNGLEFTGASYVEFRGFEVRGMDDPAVIDPDDPQQFGNGLSFYSECSFIRIIDNHVHHVGGNGISVNSSAKVLILRNRVWHCSHRSTAGNSAISVMKPWNSGLSAEEYGVVIAENTCWDNVNLFPFSHVGYITDGNGVILDYYGDNGDPSYYDNRVLVANNLAYYNGGRGFHAYHFHRVDFVNNTAWGNLRSASLQTAQGELSAVESTDIRFYNNIAYAINGQYTLAIYGGDNADCEASHNLLFGAGIQNPNSRPLLNTVMADPLFVSPGSGPAVDFKLQSGSPALDNGNSFIPLEIDLAGLVRPRGAGVDRGAYEY